MNNIVIIGITNKDDYIKRLLQYTDPESLQLIVPVDNVNPYLQNTIEQLGLDYIITKSAEELAKYPIKQILIFTDYIGISEVSLLTDANKDGIDVVFCKSDLNLK